MSNSKAPKPSSLSKSTTSSNFKATPRPFELYEFQLATTTPTQPTPNHIHFPRLFEMDSSKLSALPAEYEALGITQEQIADGTAPMRAFAARQSSTIFLAVSQMYQEHLGMPLPQKTREALIAAFFEVGVEEYIVAKSAPAVVDLTGDDEDSQQVEHFEQVEQVDQSSYEELSQLDVPAEEEPVYYSQQYVDEEPLAYLLQVADEEDVRRKEMHQQSTVPEEVLEPEIRAPLDPSAGHSQGYNHNIPARGYYDIDADIDNRYSQAYDEFHSAGSDNHCPSTPSSVGSYDRAHPGQITGDTFDPIYKGRKVDGMINGLFAVLQKLEKAQEQAEYIHTYSGPKPCHFTPSVASQGEPVYSITPEQHRFEQPNQQQHDEDLNQWDAYPAPPPPPPPQQEYKPSPAEEFLHNLRKRKAEQEEYYRYTDPYPQSAPQPAPQYTAPPPPPSNPLLEGIPWFDSIPVFPQSSLKNWLNRHQRGPKAKQRRMTKLLAYAEDKQGGLKLNEITLELVSIDEVKDESERRRKRGRFRFFDGV